jgi:predicted MFS family arabinose efflux permease
VDTKAEGHRPTLDVVGAFTVTGGLVAVVYALVGTDTHAWGSTATLVPLGIAVVLLAVFVMMETRVAKTPLVPFRLFRSRALTGANLAMMFVGGAIFSMWLFLSLYMQDVLHFSPLITGVGFLPQTAAIAIGAQVSARLVPRFGPRPPLLAGVVLAVIGMAWLSRISPTGNYIGDVLGGSVFATLGMGLSFPALAFAATAGVAREEAGLASGMLNTSRQVGGSIGLAALATIAADRTAAALRFHGVTLDRALTEGFSRVFLVATFIALAGCVAALIIPRQTAPAPSPAPAVPAGASAGAPPDR